MEDSHIGLIYHYLKKTNKLYCQDEIFDICFIGLANALNTYNEAKGCFSTYAYRCIDNEVNKYFTYINAQKRTAELISLETPITDDLLLEDAIPDESINFEDKIEFEDEIRYIKTFLDDNETKLIGMIYGVFGYKKTPRREIIREFKTSWQKINNRESYILHKIKRGVMRDYDEMFGMQRDFR